MSLLHLQQDSLTVKPLKKTSLLYRIIFLVFAMICGLCMVSICVQQMSGSRINDMGIIEGPFPQSAMELTIPLVHYPIPKTFNRYYERPICSP